MASWAELFEHRVTLDVATERVDFTVARQGTFHHISEIATMPGRVRLWFAEDTTKPRVGRPALYMVVKEESIPAVNYELVNTFETQNGFTWCLYILKEDNGTD